MLGCSEEGLVDAITIYVHNGRAGESKREM